MKAKQLLLPALIVAAMNAHADVLVPAEDEAKYADKRMRLTATLNESEKQQKLAQAEKNKPSTGSAATAYPDTETSVSSNDRGGVASLPLRELDEQIQISFRDRTLKSSIRSLTPPGWVVDLQLGDSVEKTMVSFSGETTYAQALKDILEPQGLTYLAYRNMKPQPLIVVTHGGK